MVQLKTMLFKLILPIVGKKSEENGKQYTVVRSMRLKYGNQTGDLSRLARSLGRLSW
jgi:hypothetical protein